MCDTRILRVTPTRNLRMADIRDIFGDSDSDDNDESISRRIFGDSDDDSCDVTMKNTSSFDVRIEKAEKRLQLARYQKKYRNAWTYITHRWQGPSIITVLKQMEHRLQMYSCGNYSESMFHEYNWVTTFTVSKAFQYLEQLCMLHEPTGTTMLIFKMGQSDLYSTQPLRLNKEQLLQKMNDTWGGMKAVSRYIEFFNEVSEAAYGRKIRAFYDGDMHETMRNARTSYGRMYERNAMHEAGLMVDSFFGSFEHRRQLKSKFMNTHPGPNQKLEAPDIYTLECMKLAQHARVIHRLPPDVWKLVLLPFLFNQQTIDNFNERCRVADELQVAENLLRNFRLGYAGHYDKERRKDKLLYDVYKSFMRDLHSKHDKMQKKVQANLLQMNELLEKFKAYPSGGTLVLNLCSTSPTPSMTKPLFDENDNDFDDFIYSDLLRPHNGR